MMSHFRSIGWSVFTLIYMNAANAACPTYTALTNGTIADANVVMNNFGHILGCPNFTGNVGIKMPAPNATLDVAGVINGRNYSIPGTSATAQWSKIGTFTAAQTGETIRITAYIHWGYNAKSSQDGVYYITFKTSNGVSVDANGFAGNGSWYAIGQSAAVGPGDIVWVADSPGTSALSFSLYIYLPQYTNGSHYEVTIDQNASWANVGTIGQVNPGGGSSTVLIPTPEFDIPYGNVGIGLASPRYPLEVYTSQDDQQGIAITNASAGTNAASIVNLASDSANVALYAMSSGSGGGIVFTPNTGVLRSASNASGGLKIGTGAAAPLSLFTGDQIRMTMTAAGNVGIGTSTPTQALEVNGAVKINTFASAAAIPVCENAGVLSSCSSSLRYKTDVKDATFGLGDVMRMRPVTFKWKGRGEVDFGLVAEDIAKINPLFVTYKNGQIEGVKYMQLTAVLVNAMKELKVRNDRLEAENGRLKATRDSEIASLRAQLESTNDRLNRIAARLDSHNVPKQSSNRNDPSLPSHAEWMRSTERRIIAEVAGTEQR